MTMKQMFHISAVISMLMSVLCSISGNTVVSLWKRWCGLLKERWSTVKWLPKN